jgi:hypothetical protein
MKNSNFVMLGVVSCLVGVCGFGLSAFALSMQYQSPFIGLIASVLMLAGGCWLFKRYDA